MSDSDEESDTDDFLAQYVAFKKKKDTTTFSLTPMGSFKTNNDQVESSNQVEEESTNDPLEALATQLELNGPKFTFGNHDQSQQVFNDLNRQKTDGAQTGNIFTDGLHDNKKVKSQLVTEN